MPAWFEQSWWWLFPIIALVVLLTIRVRLRGGDEPLLSRMLYVLQPDLDPRRKPRRKLTPRARVLVFVGLLIVLAVVVIDAALND